MEPRTPRGPAAALVLAALFLASPGQALSIGSGAFGPGAVVESFEGISDALPDVGPAPWAGIFEPGVSGDYGFASGVVLRGPNPGAAANGAFVHDLALPGAANNWGAHGVLDDPTEVILGTSYLGAFDNVGAFGDAVPVELLFPIDVLRVGAFVTGGLDGGSPLTVTLDVYDASDALLESRTIFTVPLASWGTNFLGIERTEGIRRVVFSGADFGLDGLTFEAAPATPVPEPGTALLLWVGLVGLVRAGRPRPRVSGPGRGSAGARTAPGGR